MHRGHFDRLLAAPLAGITDRLLALANSLVLGSFATFGAREPVQLALKTAFATAWGSSVVVAVRCRFLAAPLLRMTDRARTSC